HVAGFSLGGHSALFASLYNHGSDQPYIQSSFLACSPVRLREATENIYGSSWVARSLYKAFIEQSMNIYPYVPLLQNYFTESSEIKSIKRNEAANYVAKFTVPTYLKFTSNPSLRLAPFENKKITEVHQF